MSNTSARWAIRALIAAILLAGTAVLGAGVSSADPLGPTQNGTSWTAGDGQGIQPGPGH